MKRLLTVLIILLSLLYASSASALGDNEKNFLSVLGGIFMVDKIADHYQRKQEEKEIYNSEEEQIRRAYMEGAERKRREELEAKKRAAYRCGYEGICE